MWASSKELPPWITQEDSRGAQLHQLLCKTRWVQSWLCNRYFHYGSCHAQLYTLTSEKNCANKNRATQPGATHAPQVIQLSQEEMGASNRLLTIVAVPRSDIWGSSTELAIPIGALVNPHAWWSSQLRIAHPTRPQHIHRILRWSAGVVVISQEKSISERIVGQSLVDHKTCIHVKQLTHDAMPFKIQQ